MSTAGVLHGVRLGDSARGKLWIAQLRQIDKPDPVLVRGDQRFRSGDGHRRLAVSRFPEDEERVAGGALDGFALGLVEREGREGGAMASRGGAWSEDTRGGGRAGVGEHRHGADATPYRRRAESPAFVGDA